MKKLTELQPGDAVVLVASPGGARVVNERLVDRTRTQKNLTVKRLNRVSLTTSDGQRWNLRTGYAIGSETYSDSPRIEVYDENDHPFRAASREAFQVLVSINSGLNQRVTKNIAAALPHLKAALAALEGKTS